MPKLSICVPTRNRQDYCIETIRALARSQRQDFEVIIGDNSDDPEPIAGFLQELSDPRFSLVSPEATPLSMVDNWERLIEHTQGEWVSIIGDDDYLDPDLAKLLEAIEGVVPSVEAVTWGRIAYNWPECQPQRGQVTVPLGTNIHNVSQEEMMRKLFYWQGSSSKPKCAFGIYHGALKRTLLDRIKATFSDRYFEHPIADYESICKTVILAQGMVFSEQPMSVLGACRSSNSASLSDSKTAKARAEEFAAENKLPLSIKEFPFPAEIGVTATIAQVMQWFFKKYGLEISGWEEAFVKACEADCSAARDAEDFQSRRSGYTRALRKWKAGRLAKHFNPKMSAIAEGALPFQGVHDSKLLVDQKLGGAKTPAEFYDLLRGALASVDSIIGRLPSARKAA